ncbi:hypothetical protein Tco_0728094 [Tanacetum coccineum]|uniref:Uncharacterized protein n=1 Tax=Tanacetum coccineum TaxID=301880 RepID=A0ABQ4YN83_9ASTR
MKSAEKMEEDVMAKETGAKRKKSIPRKSTRKRQKLEEDAEKEELKGFLDIIPREEVHMSGIHILLMENGLAIHMLTEKKYPLSQEMISKMLKKKLEVDHESSQAIELLRKGEMQRIPEESVSSLKMGDEHLNTQKDSRESSVKYPIPTPRELDVIPDEYYDEDYQKRFDELEIDTPITPDIPLREETPRYFYDGSMDNGEDIIPLMRISKETGLPEKIIDKSLSESFVSRMNVCQPIPITPDVPILETVNSLKMGEVHFDTSKDSFESSVRDSFSIPRESNNLSNGVIEDFQNELNNEKNSNSETIADLPIKDSLLMVDEQINTIPSTESDEIKKSSVEILNPIPKRSNDAKEYLDERYIREIEISCDMISLRNCTDDDSEGDVPPFEEPLDDVLFPLPKVDILPIKVEPVEDDV